jgi:hypothetical protein
LRQHSAEIEALGLQVLVVTFEAANVAADYVRETGFPWVLLLDPTRALYTAYGMGRGRWWKIWGPATWWAYARLLAQGKRPQRSSADVNQLGGDVLINPAGDVVVLHVGSGPADRPAISALLAPVRKARAVS